MTSPDLSNFAQTQPANLIVQNLAPPLFASFLGKCLHLAAGSEFLVAHEDVQMRFFIEGSAQVPERAALRPVGYAPLTETERLMLASERQLNSPDFKRRFPSMEAAAGKNPGSHAGNIYTLLTYRIAVEIYANVPRLREVYIWLCRQIGKPVDQPLIASAQLVLQHDAALADVQLAVESVIAYELAIMSDFTERLIRGEWTV